GLNFPLTPVGDALWVNGTLWYHVTWEAPKGGGDGWLPASASTFHAPGTDPAWAGFDVRSPELARYLASWRTTVAAVVYDETRGRYYTYNPTTRFTMASSAKVPILLTYLTMTERQRRTPTSNELALMTAMIEHSNNDAAEVLWESEGSEAAVGRFLVSVGVRDWKPHPDGWGWSVLSALSMVRLLTLLQEGAVLTAADRQLALTLLEQVEPDQQTGVGDTRPAGARVALKDGWVPGPDGLWAVNSSGIVVVGGETYVVAVYSQHLEALETGWTIVRQVCRSVGQLLSP